MQAATGGGSASKASKSKTAPIKKASHKASRTAKVCILIGDFILSTSLIVCYAVCKGHLSSACYRSRKPCLTVYFLCSHGPPIPYPFHAVLLCAFVLLFSNTVMMSNCDDVCEPLWRSYLSIYMR